MIGLIMPMKTLVTVNAQLPTVDNCLEYFSGDSFLDYDISLFDPQFPSIERIDFSGGGSCISIDGAENLQKALKHWRTEIYQALAAGKTIFFLLNEFINDSAASGYTTRARNNRTYQTFSLNNYGVLPISIDIRNAKGKHVLAGDKRFKGLHDVLKDVIQYKVIFNSKVTNPLFTTKDGTSATAAVMKMEELPGSIVFLPYFDLSEMYTYDEEQEDNIWTDDALRLSKAVVGQLVAIDKILRSESSKSPPPSWAESIKYPTQVSTINKNIRRLEAEIETIESQKIKALEIKEELEGYTALLYESGKQLESIIEKSLTLMGYKVENYRDGDVEIDHIIISPKGFRMIGESEGKDNSAIDISKFRQLESNIGEDFERDEITVPAKGILFGNGYRLTEPGKRKLEFTEKCLTNSKRLRTALVRTSDLYEIVLYMLDNSKDEKFKAACRQAIEETEGEIVNFPSPSKAPLKRKKDNK